MSYATYSLLCFPLIPCIHSQIAHPEPRLHSGHAAYPRWTKEQVQGIKQGWEIPDPDWEGQKIRECFLEEVPHTPRPEG